MVNRTATAISRRAFLMGGAVVAGGLFLSKIPGTDGSFLLPFSPEPAWADDAGAEGKIMVVGRKQIGIAVGDIGTLDPEKQTISALSGATVTIRSLYNQKEIAGTTDAAGRAVFDIDALAEATSVDSAEPTDSNGKKLEYCFNGMITVSREGYRDAVIPLMRIRSVSAIVVPTRVLRPGEPYLRQLSFDRWDLQYTDATFVSSSDNDADHTFEAEVWVPAGKTVNLRLYATSEKDGSSSVKEIGAATFKGADSDSRQKTSFKARYLCPSWPGEVLPVGCKVMAELECEGTTTAITSGMEIKEAPFVDDEDGEIDVVPESKGTSGVRIAKLPGGLPKPLGGSSFKLWTPSFGNVMYNFSPLGYLMIGLQLGSLKLTKDAGPFEDGGWKRQTKQSAGEQFNKLCKKQAKDIDDVGKMYTDKETGRRKYFASECSKEVSIKGCFQVYAQLSYDWDTSVWSGDLNAVLGGGVEASWTIQMVIVVVPVYISFDLGAQVTVGLKFAARSHGSNLDKLLENAVYEADKSGAGFTFTISVGLTLGVGVADVLCAYIRGEGYITMSIAYQNSSDRDTARLRLGVGLEASLGVQILLFSWSGKLWSQDWPGLYDSYDEANDALDTLAAGGDLPLDANGIPQFTAADMAEKMEIVENYILRNRAEFAAKASAIALYADEELEPAFVEPQDLGDGNLLWDVPPQNGFEVDENGTAFLSDEEPEGHFDYLGNSNTNEMLPNSKNPTANGSVRVGISDVNDGVSGGIRPSVDKTIFSGVFSDPRTKTVYSTMFRIATVRYGDEARTRVVYTSLNDTSWDNPQVIEFDPVFSSGAEPISRMDMYDYDFAVARLNGLFGDYLYLMIISGTRPQGDETTFAEANSKTVVSVVRLYNAYFQHAPWQCDRAICWSPNVGSNKVVSFSSPVISTYADMAHFDRETNSCVIGACLVAVAPKQRPQDLVTIGASRLLTFHIEHRGMNEFRVLTNSSFDRLAFSGTSKLVIGPVAPDQPLDPKNYDRVNRHVYLGAVGSSGAQTYRVQVNYNDTVGAIYTRFAAGLQSEGAYAQRLYPTGNDGEFYAICTDKSLFEKSAEDGADVSYRRDGRLYLMRIDGDDATYTPITPTDTCVPSEMLISKDGRYLFYLVNKEGKSSRGFTPEGEVGPQKPASQTKASDNYRVMALARVGNLFTKPFTLAVLDRPIDYMTSMVSWGSTATLIGTEITNFASSRADIRDIRIPLAAVATPLSVATEGPFAFAGEDTVFNVEVRNDGNTILRGATFNLHEVTVGADGAETVNPTPACSANVDFQPDLVTLAEGEESSASAYDVELLSEEFTSSPLASAGELGLLVPGQTQSYKVTFHIPDSWASSSASSDSVSSERKVRIKITNPRYLEFNADSAALLGGDEGGEGAGDSDIDFDNSNGDFEDLSPEEWAQFFDFLQLLEALYEEQDVEDWPETELNVLDGGLQLENIGDLHNGEISSGFGGGSSSGGNDGVDGPDKGSDTGSAASANRLSETGDRNLIGRLLFGLGR